MTCMRVTRRLLAPFLTLALVAIAAFALPSSSMASTAIEAPWSVDVISDTATVSFPSSITFAIELDSPVSVAEARLYCEVVGQDVAFYSYPELQGDRHVQATFTLYTSGQEYIPSGTQIEYWYTLYDGQGDSVQTPTQSFTYLDTRFDWRVTAVGSMDIYWYGGASTDLALLTPGLEKAFQRIEQVLQVTPSERFRGLIYNSQTDAAQAFPTVSATLQQEQLFAGYAFSDKGVFLGVDMAHYLIAHETTHLYTGLFMGSASALLPTWVEEGLAVYMQAPTNSYTGLLGSLRGQDLLPLQSMESLPGLADEIRLFYAEAPTVVAYLIEVHGEEKFRAFLSQFKMGAQVDEALRATYDFGVEELDVLWQGDLPEAPNKSPFDVNFWFITVPSAALALLAVAIMVLLGVRHIRKRGGR